MIKSECKRATQKGTIIDNRQIAIEELHPSNRCKLGLDKLDISSSDDDQVSRLWI